MRAIYTNKYYTTTIITLLVLDLVLYIYLLKYENEQYAYVQYILVYKNKSTHFRRREKYICPISIYFEFSSQFN